MITLAKKMALFESLSSIEDPRRAQGLRTKLEQLLSMVIISYLCGHVGFRGVARFCKAHSAVLTQELGLTHQTPSYVTFRDVLNRISETEMIRAFNTWMAGVMDIKEGLWISGDGKALGSTVVNAHRSDQDFQAIVSFFCQKSGLVYSLEQYKNKSKESGEMDVARFLIGELKGMGAIIRLDALHTQKKRSVRL